MFVSAELERGARAILMESRNDSQPHRVRDDEQPRAFGDPAPRGSPAAAPHGRKDGRGACPRGRVWARVGTELILDVFGAEHVDAFDLDPRMVERARKRLLDRRSQVRVRVGDASAIDAPASTYDAVFDFGIIHHVPDWRAALAEIHRVLKPGGRFYAEEMLRSFIVHPLTRRFLEHPLEDRFDAPAFAGELRASGFEWVAVEELWDSVGWFCAQK